MVTWHPAASKIAHKSGPNQAALATFRVAARSQRTIRPQASVSGGGGVAEGTRWLPIRSYCVAARLLCANCSDTIIADAGLTVHGAGFLSYPGEGLVKDGLGYVANAVHNII